MTNLKTLVAASSIAAVILGVNGGNAWGQQTAPDPEAAEARCIAWEIVEKSQTRTLRVTKRGAVETMHCMPGHQAALQKCIADPNLHRFRCMLTPSK